MRPTCVRSATRGRGHALTIDSGWGEVADTALALARRFAPRCVKTTGLIACLLLVTALSACGGEDRPALPSVAAQRTLAERFATALFRGDAFGARAFLVRADEPALVFLVRQATARWRRHHASLDLPARRRGDRWEVRYAGRRTYRDGRFETETGDLVVIVAPSAAGARVLFFTFAHVRTRFSTHHDAQLLPAKR
jgi:hypothetical protein